MSLPLYFGPILPTGLRERGNGYSASSHYPSIAFLDMEPNLNSNLRSLQKEVSVHCRLKRSISGVSSVLSEREEGRNENEGSKRKAIGKALQDYVSPQGWKMNGVGFGVLSKLDVFLH